MNFHNEKKTIREKYRQTGFPTWFVDKVIHQFDQMLIDKQTENEPKIANFLFAKPKEFIFVEIPFCISNDYNENTIKRFLYKLQSFINRKFNTTVKFVR